LLFLNTGINLTIVNNLIEDKIMRTILTVLVAWFSLVSCTFAGDVNVFGRNSMPLIKISDIANNWDGTNISRPMKIVGIGKIGLLPPPSRSSFDTTIESRELRCDTFGWALLKTKRNCRLEWIVESRYSVGYKYGDSQVRDGVWATGLRYVIPLGKAR
jgi:hypothetical protein